MKAMIFAAGLGTRLMEYTADRPKALVKVKGKTLLQHCAEHLKSFGINTIVQTINSSGDTVYCDVTRTTTSCTATIAAVEATDITILVQKIG